MKLQVLASDFKDSNFHDQRNCPLATAAKRIFKNKEVKEIHSYILVDGSRQYNHPIFGIERFEQWLAKAKELKFNRKEILFEMELTEK